MKKAYIYAGISILFWSSLATVSKLLLGELNSYQVLTYSAAFAALALLIVGAVTGKLKLLRAYGIKDYVITLLIGLPGTFLYYVFLYMGTERMAASQAFIINYLWPIMSVVFACIILKERLTWRKCAAFALSILGVVTVAGRELIQFDGETLSGVLLCVLAAVSYGAFTALNNKWSYDYVISMMLSFALSAILSLIINLSMGGSLAVSILHLLGFGWNGVFVMALATVTWALALKEGGTAKISSLAYITPFLSLIWTYLVLREPISPLSIVGLMLIVLGIFMQLKEKKK
ncbi:MAG: DMT family transporter [Clostridia bacterium]|nr:DMT family transporter [Clostridia bacterium]